MSKKLPILLFLLLVSNHVFAIPIMNENVSSTDYVTIYGDNLNPNVYYFAPSYLSVCTDKNHNPILTDTDIRNHGELQTIIFATMSLGFKDKIADAIFDIKARNPQAHFSGLPFSASKMILKDKVLSVLVSENACDHVAGTIGQDQPCSFILNEKGRKIFLKNVRKKLISLCNFSIQ